MSGLDSLALVTRCQSPDLVNFTGSMRFYGAPFTPVVRVFEFEIYDFRRSGGFVVIKEDGKPILDVLTGNQKPDWDECFVNRKWPHFDAKRRAMVRYILMGVHQAALSMWHLCGSHSARYLDGITAEEFASLRFEPLVTS